jgi:DNA-binding NtrC family response regulator
MAMDMIETNLLQRLQSSGALLGQEIFALVGQSISEVERKLILATLHECKGNRTTTARILGVSIRTIRNKLHEYTLQGNHVPAPANQNWQPLRL